MSDPACLGFGVIGAGMIGNFHAVALKHTDVGTLVAVCEVSEERGKAYGEEHGCAVYSDLDAFLAHPGLDVVTIATPSGLHLEPGKKAAAAKKHIICEKPLEVNIEKADELIAVCEENGVVLSGVFPRRFQKAVVLMKETIDSGRLGKITLASAYIKWFRTQEYYDSGGWRGTWDLDGGGALMNQSIHTVDRLLHFMGDVESVCAFARRAAHERIEVEDITVAILQFKSGALGTIEATTNAFSQTGHPAEVHICGTEGSVFLKDNHFSVWDFEKETEEDEKIREELGVKEGAEGVGAADPTAIDFEGHQKNFEDAVHAIRTGGEPMVGGREARRSIELIQAVYQSAQNNGERVCLPLEKSPDLKSF